MEHLRKYTEFTESPENWINGKAIFSELFSMVWGNWPFRVRGVNGTRGFVPSLQRSIRV